MIDFAARLVNARHGTDEVSGADGACVLGYRRRAYSGEPTVNPGFAVPNQRVEKAAHRVNQVIPRGDLHRPADVTLICSDVLASETGVPNQ